MLLDFVKDIFFSFLVHTRRTSSVFLLFLVAVSMSPSLTCPSVLVLCGTCTFYLGSRRALRAAVGEGV